MFLDETFQRLAVDSAVARDDGGDRFPEALVRHADDDAVAHPGKSLHHLFDLFGEHLLAAGVDAYRAAAEQRESPAVVVHHRPVARHREPAVLSLDEGSRALLRILVVADRLRAADADQPLGAGIALDRPQLF